MKFHLTGTPQDISAESLIVTAETPLEVLWVWKHYRLDAGTPDGAVAMAQAIQTGTYTHTTAPHDKSKWFDVDVYLNALAPYTNLLKQVTGFDITPGELPNMDLTADYPDRLGFTHLVDACGIVGGMFHAHVYINAEEWNGQPAEVRAQVNAEDYVMEDVGKRKHEREYITAGNGHMVANPQYLKRHRAEAGLGAPWLWKRIFSWWRANHASPAQFELLAAADAMPKYKGQTDRDYDIRKGGGEEASLIGYSMYVVDPAGTIDWDGKGTKAKCFTWDEFAKLGKVAA